MWKRKNLRLGPYDSHPSVSQSVHVPPLQKTRHERMLLAHALSQGAHSDCSRTQISLGCSQDCFRETDIRDGLESSSQLACKPMIFSTFCFLRCMFRFHTLPVFLFTQKKSFISFILPPFPSFLPSSFPPVLASLPSFLPFFLSLPAL